MPPGTRPPPTKFRNKNYECFQQKSTKNPSRVQDQEKFTYLAPFPRCLPIWPSQFLFLENFLNDTVSQRNLLRVNSNYSLCPKYLSPRLLMIQISLNTESIRFATLQAIRMPTTYKCPDRIYRSGQIFVIKL